MGKVFRRIMSFIRSVVIGGEEWQIFISQFSICLDASSEQCSHSFCSFLFTLLLGFPL